MDIEELDELPEGSVVGTGEHAWIAFKARTGNLRLRTGSAHSYRSALVFANRPYFIAEGKPNQKVAR